jgi:hypothetical protein
VTTRGAGESKLFHAIVGLGLAAAACGDVADLPGHAPDAKVPRDGHSSDAGGRDAGHSTLSHPDATVTDAATLVDVHRTDAGRDVVIDAGAARDAAHDVAREAWPPPPIK